MEKRTMFLGVQVEQNTMLITALHLLHRLPHLQYSTIGLTIASSAKTNRRPTCRTRVSAARNGPWLNTDAPSRVLTTATGNKNVSVSWAVPRRDPLIPDPVAVVFRQMSVLEALLSLLLYSLYNIFVWTFPRSKDRDGSSPRMQADLPIIR